jgi:hypothetical protein
MKTTKKEEKSFHRALMMINIVWAPFLPALFIDYCILSEDIE